MRNLIGFGMALFVVCGFSGCGGYANTPDGVMKEMIDKTKELNTILEGITDEASGEAAVSKIEAIGKRMKELKEKGESFKLSPDEKKKLEEKYRTELTEIFKKMMGNMAKAGAKAPKAMAKVKDLK